MKCIVCKGENMVGRVDGLPICIECYNKGDQQWLVCIQELVDQLAMEEFNKTKIAENTEEENYRLRRSVEYRERYQRDMEAQEHQLRGEICDLHRKLNTHKTDIINEFLDMCIQDFETDKDNQHEENAEFIQELETRIRITKGLKL